MNELNNLNYVEPTEKQHKNPLPIIIITLLIIIIAGLCVYIAYDRGYITFDVDKEKPKEIVNEEKEITDKDLIEKINKQVFIVEKIGLMNANHQIGTIYNTKEKLLSTAISEQDKFVSIVHSFDNDKSQLELATYEIVKRYNAEYLEGLTEENFNSMEYYYTIDISKFKEKYKDLYGSDVLSYESIALYPTVFFDNETNKLLIDYEEHTGLGKLSEEIERYTYKVTEDNDNVYVYVAVGLKTYDDENITCTYYYDVEQEKKANELPCDSEQTNSTINQENYNNFTKYKYTFSKKENKYIFEGIERIKKDE